MTSISFQTVLLSALGKPKRLLRALRSRWTGVHRTAGGGAEVALLAAWLALSLGALGYSGWRVQEIEADARDHTESTAMRLSLLASELLALSLQQIEWAMVDLAAATSGEAKRQASTRLYAAPYVSDVHLISLETLRDLEARQMSVRLSGLVLVPPEGGPAANQPMLIALDAPAAPVAAAFDLPSFAATIAKAKPPVGWSVFIMGMNGVALARSPPAADHPQGASSQGAAHSERMATLLNLAARGGGRMIEVSPFDGALRLMELRPVGALPLAVAVSLSLTEEARHVALHTNDMLIHVLMAWGCASALLCALMVAVVRRNRAAARALARDRAKTAFLAALSHEFRTPLNAVIGFSELMRLTCAQQLDAGGVERLDIIHSSGLHLQSVVDRALDFVWVENAGRSLSLDTLSLGEIVASLEPQWRSMAAARAQTVSLGCGALEMQAQCGGCAAIGDRFAARRVAEALATFASRMAAVGGVWGVGFGQGGTNEVRLIAWSGARPGAHTRWRTATTRLTQVADVYAAPDPDSLALEAGMRLADAMGWRLETTEDGSAISAVAPKV